MMQVKFLQLVINNPLKYIINDEEFDVPVSYRDPFYECRTVISQDVTTNEHQKTGDSVEMIFYRLVVQRLYPRHEYYTDGSVLDDTRNKNIFEYLCRQLL